MLSVGIDPSSQKVAVVILDGDGVLIDYAIMKLTDKEAPGRCLTAFRFIRMLLKANMKIDPDIHVMMEDPIVGTMAGPYATIIQSKVNGALTSGITTVVGADHVTGIKPSQWKKISLGNGNFPKAQIPGKAESDWPKLWAAAQPTGRARKVDGDIIDAGYIAWAQHLVGTGEVDLQKMLSATQKRKRTNKRKAHRARAAATR